MLLLASERISLKHPTNKKCHLKKIKKLWKKELKVAFL